MLTPLSGKYCFVPIVLSARTAYPVSLGRARPRYSGLGVDFTIWTVKGPLQAHGHLSFRIHTYDPHPSVRNHYKNPFRQASAATIPSGGCPRPTRPALPRPAAATPHALPPAAAKHACLQPAAPADPAALTAGGPQRATSPETRDPAAVATMDSASIPQSIVLMASHRW